MLVDMGSEWLLIFVGERFEVSPILKVLNHGSFDVCKGKELFYDHVRLAITVFSILICKSTCTSLQNFFYIQLAANGEILVCLSA